MKYIDCYKNINLYKIRGFCQRRKHKKNINKLIKQYESNVDFLRYWINDYEKQMKKWEDDNDESYSEVINTYPFIISAYKLTGRLSMINLDVLIAMKYLAYAKSDIECSKSEDTKYGLFVSPIFSIRTASAAISRTRNVSPTANCNPSLLFPAECTV